MGSDCSSIDKSSNNDPCLGHDRRLYLSRWLPTEFVRQLRTALINAGSMRRAEFEQIKCQRMLSETQVRASEKERALYSEQQRVDFA